MCYKCNYGFSIFIANLLDVWCFITWFISILYWHDATSGWRLCLDSIFAKFSFCVVACFGAVYGRDSVSAALGWTIGGGIVCLYLTSCRLFEAKNKNWIYFHGIMHICVGSNMAICVWTMHRHLVTTNDIDRCSLGAIDIVFHYYGNMCKSLYLEMIK